jgi:hypothetical protein
MKTAVVVVVAQPHASDNPKINVRHIVQPPAAVRPNACSIAGDPD